MPKKNKSQSPSLLRSMTGFGRASNANAHANVEIELRTVNGKGLATKLRLPNERLELEPELELILRKHLVRGSVQGQIKLRTHTHTPASLDHMVLKRYLREWRQLEKELGLEAKDPSLSQLLALPGTYDSPEEPKSATRSIARLVKKTFSEATLALVLAREKEGARMAKELLRLVSRLERLRKQVEAYIPKVRRQAGARLKERVTAALLAAGKSQGDLDLSRELVALAERADIREEVARLAIHCERLTAMIEKGGACGRELEFMIQECHREVTTLGNKSADSKMSNFVVKMKMLVQQLKEQAANVE